LKRIIGRLFVLWKKKKKKKEGIRYILQKKKILEIHGLSSYVDDDSESGSRPRSDYTTRGTTTTTTTTTTPTTENTVRNSSVLLPSVSSPRRRT